MYFPEVEWIMQKNNTTTNFLQKQNNFLLQKVAYN